MKARATLDSLKEKVRDLEREQANNKAIWSAITDIQNKETELRISHEAGMKHLNWVAEHWLVLREQKTSTQAPEPTPFPKAVPPKTNPDQFRTEYEQRYPSKK